MRIQKKRFCLIHHEISYTGPKQWEGKIAWVKSLFTAALSSLSYHEVKNSSLSSHQMKTVSL